MSIDTGFTIEDRIKAVEEAIPVPCGDYRKLEAENADLKARVAELEKNNLRLGLIAAAVVIENKVAEYDYEHGITEPDTGCRVYPGNGEDYIDSMIELAEELRMIADKEPSHDNQ